MVSDDSASSPLSEVGISSLKKFLHPPLHGSTTEAVTIALREAILSGALPPPTWLREAELACALAVSRTPVREALRRISDEGLTRKVVNLGTQVAPMTLDNILAVYAVRESLEGLAARTAAKKRPSGLVETLRSALRETEMNIAEGLPIAAVNFAFHQHIREASENPYLERFLIQVEHAVRRFGSSAYEVPGRSEATLREHCAILEAIATGDAEQAEQLAMEHMRTARKVRINEMLKD